MIPFFTFFMRRFIKVKFSNALNMKPLNILIEEMRQIVDVLTLNCKF